jgi:hypothetical protein
MKTDYDKEQFDKIASLETDVAVIKREIAFIRDTQQSQGRELLRELRRLEKKICQNQDLLRDDNNRSEGEAKIRASKCEKRFEKLEDGHSRIWEKLGTVSIFLYIIAREVIPKIADIL